MRIAHLVPGTGSFYCGNCLRESAIARALRAHHHDVMLIPLYLPLYQEEPSDAPSSQVFMGGVNLYLAQKKSILSHLPAGAKRLLDRPGLLRLSSRLGDMTDAAKHADMTVAMLRADDDYQRAEVSHLANWFREHETPDVICLTNVLLSGLARLLKNELDVPVASTLHGEDTFLDALPDAQREEAWSVLRDRMNDLDAVIPVSDYYGGVMRRRLSIDPSRVHRVHNGIDLRDIDDNSVPRRDSPTRRIGYLARMCPAKGLHTLVDAFIELHRRGHAELFLEVAGVELRGDRRYVKELKARLRSAECGNRASFHPNISRERKLEFLRGLDLFSVPATYGESFGLYVIEAMAHGVPVVQPRHGAFPEIIEQSGGGVLCEPDDPVSLADELERLLNDPKRVSELGDCGRESVKTYFNADRMAREVAAVYTQLAQRRPAAARTPAATCPA